MVFSFVVFVHVETQLPYYLLSVYGCSFNMWEQVLFLFCMDLYVFSFCCGEVIFGVTCVCCYSIEEVLVGGLPVLVVLVGSGYQDVVDVCNMCTCSGNGTPERAVQDLLCLVDLYLVYLI